MVNYHDCDDVESQFLIKISNDFRLEHLLKLSIQPDSVE
jgi:hypothetical protein